MSGKPYIRCVFGYGIEPLESRFGDSLQEQEAVCKDTYDRLREQGQLNNNTVWGGFYADRTAEFVMRALSRPAFGELVVRRRRGDILIVPNLHTLGKSIADIAVTIKSLHESGVTIHVASFDHAITGWGHDWIHAMFHEASAHSGKAIRHVAAIRRELAPHLVPRTAPIGWCWVGKKGRRQLIPFNRQRSVAQKIVKLRDEQGMTFAAIAKMLTKSGYRPTGPRVRNHKNLWGRLWEVSETTAVRMYRAAKHGFPPLSAARLAARYAAERREAYARASRSQPPATHPSPSAISDTAPQVPGQPPSSPASVPESDAR